MKPRRPIGIIRPLVPAARRMRGFRAPLVPMVWRGRPRRAGPISILRIAQPAPVPAASSVAINLHLVWPASPPAAPAPATIVERVLRQIFRAGQDGARVETNRLFRLVQTLWRSGPDAAVALALPQPPAPSASRCAAAGLEWSVPFRRSTPRFEAPGDGPSPRPMARRAAAMRAPALPRPGAGGGDTPVAIRPAWPRRRLPAAKLSAALPSAPVARVSVRRLPKPAVGLFADDSPAKPPASPARSVPRIGKRAKGAGGPLALAPPETWPAAAAPQSWKPRTPLVWRDPLPAETRPEPLRSTDTASLAQWRDAASFAAGRASAAPPVAAPAAVQAPDIGRLVEEVVRRLERIGRDERLRRGL